MRSTALSAESQRASPRGASSCQIVEAVKKKALGDRIDDSPSDLPRLQLKEKRPPISRRR
jgi:hypothetical protein